MNLTKELHQLFKSSNYILQLPIPFFFLILSFRHNEIVSFCHHGFSRGCCLSKQVRQGVWVAKHRQGIQVSETLNQLGGISFCEGAKWVDNQKKKILCPLYSDTELVALTSWMAPRILTGTWADALSAPSTLGSSGCPRESLVPHTLVALYVANVGSGLRVRPIIRSCPVSYKLYFNMSEPQFPPM